MQSNVHGVLKVLDPLRTFLWLQLWWVLYLFATFPFCRREKCLITSLCGVTFLSLVIDHRWGVTKYRWKSSILWRDDNHKAIVTSVWLGRAFPSHQHRWSRNRKNFFSWVSQQALYFSLLEVGWLVTRFAENLRPSAIDTEKLYSHLHLLTMYLHKGEKHCIESLHTSQPRYYCFVSLPDDRSPMKSNAIWMKVIDSLRRVIHCNAFMSPLCD